MLDSIPQDIRPAGGYSRDMEDIKTEPSRSPCSPLSALCMGKTGVSVQMLARVALCTATLYGTCTTQAFAQLQPVGDLPGAPYYVGREMLRVGDIQGAAERFESLLNVAAQTATDGWIDSIPSLVMLGECFYQQGNLAKAIEQYDAALAISIRFPGWPDYFSLIDVPVAVSDPFAKGINWFRLSRPSSSLALPESVQLIADLAQARQDSSGNVIAPVFLTARLDTTEVFRALGIALVRRWQILGPLAANSAMTDGAIQHFAYNIQQTHAWTQTSWGALRALARLARDEGIAVQQLRSASYVRDQYDYYLSPLCLLVQGKLALEQGQYQAAIVHLQDAGILAAQYEQFDTLAESIIELSDAACANERIDLIDALGRAAAWTGKRSELAQMACLSGAAELNVHKGNAAEAKKIAGRIASALRPRGVLLPRYKARLAFLETLILLNENNSAAAWNRLTTALTLMRGNAESGAIPEVVFQKQVALDLLASGQLSRVDADKVLTMLLGEPTRTAWEVHPLETLSAITIPALPAYMRWLQTGDRQDVADVTKRMDCIQREQLYEALPLAGRKFAWLSAISTPNSLLPTDVRPDVLKAIQQSPGLADIPQRLSTVLQQVRQSPAPLDDRQLKADTRQHYLQLDGLSNQLEHLLLSQCVSRQPLRRFAPNDWNLAIAQQQLGPRDCLVSFVVASDEIIAVAINNQSIELWRIADMPSVLKGLKTLYQQIGLSRTAGNKVNSDVLSSSAPWRQTAEQLSSTLFAPNSLSMIESAERLIIVPHGFLWYVPFETLIASRKMPLVSNAAITYVPTLGSFHTAYRKSNLTSDALIVSGKFFAPDKSVNTREVTAIAAARGPSAIIHLDQKVTASSSFWLQARTDELVVLNRLNMVDDGWAIRPIGIDSAAGSLLSDWMNLPQAVPQLVILPGLETSIRTGEFGNGNDVFLPVCAVVYGGSRGVISRWATGGMSSSRYLQRLRQELSETTPISKSLRRATLALWAEQFAVSDEPVLKPAGGADTELTSGEHPLLWSGYMAVGN